MEGSPTLNLASKSQPSASQLNPDSASANDLSFAQALEQTEDDVEVGLKFFCIALTHIIGIEQYSESGAER